MSGDDAPRSALVQTGGLKGMWPLSGVERKLNFQTHCARFSAYILVIFDWKSFTRYQLIIFYLKGYYLMSLLQRLGYMFAIHALISSLLCEMIPWSILITTVRFQISYYICLPVSLFIITNTTFWYTVLVYFKIFLSSLLSNIEGPSVVTLCKTKHKSHGCNLYQWDYKKYSYPDTYPLDINPRITTPGQLPPRKTNP